MMRQACGGRQGSGLSAPTASSTQVPEKKLDKPRGMAYLFRIVSIFGGRVRRCFLEEVLSQCQDLVHTLWGMRSEDMSPK